MADSGFNWGTWQWLQLASANWSVSMADNAVNTSDVLSLDEKASCEIGLYLDEDNSGAIDGTVTVSVFGTWDGTEYENASGSPWAFTVTPVQNETVVKRFSVDPGSYGSIKLRLNNTGGQELVTKVKYRTATIPPASA